MTALQMANNAVVSVILDDYAGELKMLERAYDMKYAEKYPDVLDYFNVQDAEIDSWYEAQKKSARENAVSMVMLQTGWQYVA